MSRQSRIRKRKIALMAERRRIPQISYDGIGPLFRERFSADFYACEIAHFESPEDPEYPFLVDAAMGHALHIAAEHLGADPDIGRRLVDMATLIWDDGDERARNMIRVSFLENFDNLPIDRTKALHRLMKPHMRKMLEDELAQFNIDWMW